MSSAQQSDRAKTQEFASGELPNSAASGALANAGIPSHDTEEARSISSLRPGIIKRFRISLMLVAASLLTIVAATIIVVEKTGELATENFIAVIEADAASDLGHLMHGVRDSAAASGSFAGVANTVHRSSLEAGDEVDEIVLTISDIASIDALPEWILWSKGELKYRKAVIYDLTGDVLWSNEPIEEHPPLWERLNFLSAVAGIPASEIEIESVSTGSESKGSNYTAEVYLPLRSTPNGEIIGVVELYTDVTDQYSALVTNTINDARTTTLVTMIGLFIIIVGFVITSDILKARAHQRELAQKQALNEVRSEFLSRVSHELRTPLTTMLAFSDVLRHNRAGNLTGRQMDQLNLISRGGHRLDELIDDLLDVSRSETGRFKLEPAPFDIQNMLEEVVSSCSSIFDERQQELKLTNLVEPTWLNGDRSRITQVFSNLLSNAAKYSPSETLVEIRAVIEDDYVRVTVEDHGIGISEADQKQLFVPFFRADNSETIKESGTGLGLVIAKAILERHGGRLELDSYPGAGTTVRTWLPGILAEPPSNADEIGSAYAAG